MKSRSSPLEEHFVTINLDDKEEGLEDPAPLPLPDNGPTEEWVKHSKSFHCVYTSTFLTLVVASSTRVDTDTFLYVFEEHMGGWH